MSRRHYRLPPWTALAAFEAAARHLSFKRAADELNVTPGAISHQIKALETELGVAVFDRVHRGVDLTEAGRALARALRGAFLDISEALDTARQGAADTGVTVAATTAMSALWLTPALSRFWRSSPDVRVNQVVSDTLDLGLSVPDLVISYGPLEDDRFDGIPLFRDALVPLCSPALAETAPSADLSALAAMPLVHLDGPDENWTTWPRWFAELGYSGPLRRGVRVNNYVIALQAAEDGAGMVLGWRRLVAPLLGAGRLVALDGFRLDAPTSFFLSGDRQRAERPGVAELRDWLAELAQSGKDEFSSTYV